MVIWLFLAAVFLLDIPDKECEHERSVAGGGKTAHSCSECENSAGDISDAGSINGRIVLVRASEQQDVGINISREVVDGGRPLGVAVCVSVVRYFKVDGSPLLVNDGESV